MVFMTSLPSAFNDRVGYCADSTIIISTTVCLPFFPLKKVELGVFPVQLAVHFALQFVLVQLVLNTQLKTHVHLALVMFVSTQLGQCVDGCPRWSTHHRFHRSHRTCCSFSSWTGVGETARPIGFESLVRFWTTLWPCSFKSLTLFSSFQRALSMVLHGRQLHCSLWWPSCPSSSWMHICNPLEAGSESTFVVTPNNSMARERERTRAWARVSMHLFMIVLMGIDCCHYYSHFFVLYYDVERCNDCNNAAVLYPIAWSWRSLSRHGEKNNAIMWHAWCSWWWGCLRPIMMITTLWLPLPLTKITKLCASGCCCGTRECHVAVTMWSWWSLKLL